MRIFFVIIAMILSLKLFAQKDSIYLLKTIDDMSDKINYSPSRKLILENEEKTQEILLRIYFNEDLKVRHLVCEMINIGSCCENNEVIILFEDSTKIVYRSWNKFNCEGRALFMISNEMLDKENEDLINFSSKKITKVKITNGHTFDSFTRKVAPIDQDYFIQLIYAANQKKIIEIKEK